MNRYVLPAMFTAVTGLCLLLMCAAILDGAWVAAAVMLVPPIFLTYVAGECRRSSSPGRRQS